MVKNLAVCTGIALALIGAPAGKAAAGDVIVSKWSASSKQCRGAKGATATVRYVGEGSKLVSNACFRAVFQDGSYCDGTDGDFDDIRISDNGAETTRAVCFCRSDYRIRDVAYRCQDSR